MYPRAFDYVAPTSLDEALGALGEDAKVMAGGMSLLPLMKMRLFSPAVIVDIGRIGGLDGVAARHHADAQRCLAELDAINAHCARPDRRDLERG